MVQLYIRIIIDFLNEDFILWKLRIFLFYAKYILYETKGNCLRWKKRAIFNINSIPVRLLNLKSVRRSFEKTVLIRNAN